MRAGQFLDSRYRMEALAGRGGMGEVWRATDTRLDRTVAIKLLRPDLADSAESRSRFKREARALTALDVPGTARIRDYGEEVIDGEEVAYLVLEYVEGTTLSRILSTQGPMEASRLLPILAQVAETLDAVHRNGIIHRDIKPGNIMLGSDGKVTLLDFGIAHSVTFTQITRTGHIMGSLSYASPEQLNGKTFGPESDVYSLGVVAFECLSGDPPFTGDPMEILHGHMWRQPPDPPAGTPRAMVRAIAKALNKSPGDRYVSASDFVAACGGTLAEVTPTSVRLSPRQRRAFTLTGVLATAAILVGTLLVLAPWAPAEAPLTNPDTHHGSHHPWVPKGLDTGTLLDSQQGVIYKWDKGALYWYRHKGYADGSVSWDRNSGKRIGGDWHGRRVIAGCHGILYAIDKAGELYWYRHTDPLGGKDKWSKASGTSLHRNFGKYTHLIATAVSVLYAVDADGNLNWFLHSPPEKGEVIWNADAGSVSETGWGKKSVRLMSGGGNLVYTVKPNGDVVWHEDEDQGDNTGLWHEETVGHGFDEYESVVANVGGDIYARTPDGKLYWFRHLGISNGAAEWKRKEGVLVNPS